MTEKLTNTASLGIGGSSVISDRWMMIAAAIEDHEKQHPRLTPSMNEISRRMTGNYKLTASVRYALKRMASEGYVSHGENLYDDIRLTDKGRSVLLSPAFQPRLYRNPPHKP